MGDMTPMVAGAINQVSKSILTHGAMAVAIIRKHQFTLAAELPDCLQYGEALGANGTR